MSQLANYDYNEHLLLFVDDEPVIRKHFLRVFGKTFNVILAEDGARGLERFREHKGSIGVVIADQRMPNACGTELLEEIARLKPGVIRILSTAYADPEVAITAINGAGIYHYVSKPWDVPKLEQILKDAMKLYMKRLEEQKILREPHSRNGTASGSNTSIPLGLVKVRTGDECPRTGIWMAEGIPPTTAKVAEGDLMPQFHDEDRVWKLISPS